MELKLPDGLSVLNKYHKIVVTGPQRSGTRIATKVLAESLSFEYIDEVDFQFRSISSLVSFLLQAGRQVIQAPALSSICHLIDTRDTAVVFMMRSLDEILVSQNRIGWGVADQALYKEEDLEARMYFRSGRAAQIKYEVWERWQKPHMMCDWFELSYSSLSYHPLWIDKESRTKFSAFQTSLDKRVKLL